MKRRHGFALALLVVGLIARWLPASPVTSVLWVSLGLGLMAGLVCVAAMLIWRWHRRDRLGLLP